MAKCPACGFESPDDALCCDFCKEPFRRGRPSAVREKTEKPEAGIPPEFLSLGTGGSIPRVPPWLRYAAWAVLAACFLATAALIGAYSARPAPGAPDGQPSQTR